MGKTVDFLRDLFASGDLDGSGSLEKEEFMSLLDDESTMAKMQSLGLVEKKSVGLVDKHASSERNCAESSILLLFNLIDGDSSGSLSIEEVLSWFLEVREMVRQRELEDRFMRLGDGRQSLKQELGVTAKKSFGSKVSAIKRMTKATVKLVG